MLLTESSQRVERERDGGGRSFDRPPFRLLTLADREPDAIFAAVVGEVIVVHTEIHAAAAARGERAVGPDGFDATIPDPDKQGASRTIGTRRVGRCAPR